MWEATETTNRRIHVLLESGHHDIEQAQRVIPLQSGVEASNTMFRSHSAVQRGEYADAGRCERERHQRLKFGPEVLSEAPRRSTTQELLTSMSSDEWGLPQYHGLRVSF